MLTGDSTLLLHPRSRHLVTVIVPAETIATTGSPSRPIAIRATDAVVLSGTDVLPAEHAGLPQCVTLPPGLTKTGFPSDPSAMSDAPDGIGVMTSSQMISAP